MKTKAKDYFEALNYVLGADFNKGVTLLEACRRVGRRAAERKKIDQDSVETFAHSLRRAYQRSRLPKKKKRDRRRLLTDAEEQLIAGIAEGMARAGKTVGKSAVVAIAKDISKDKPKKSLFTQQWWDYLPCFSVCSFLQGGEASKGGLNSISQKIKQDQLRLRAPIIERLRIRSTLLMSFLKSMKVNDLVCL